MLCFLAMWNFSYFVPYICRTYIVHSREQIPWKKEFKFTLLHLIWNQFHKYNYTGTSGTRSTITAITIDNCRVHIAIINHAYWIYPRQSNDIANRCSEISPSNFNCIWEIFHGWSTDIFSHEKGSRSCPTRAWSLTYR